MLQKLNERPKVDTGGNKWSYSLGASPLGGMEDSYIKLQGPCHPDFATIPVGRPGGVKMCVRKPDPSCPPTSTGTTNIQPRIGHSLQVKAMIENERGQGYHRGSVDLYDPKQNFPNQKWNPQYYSDRRIPYEQDLLRADYIRLPLEFSGTGIKTTRIPHELRDSDQPYFQYGYSFTQKEDDATGNRTATRWDQTRPPYKYDITRLHQPYPIWKQEHEVMGHPQDRYDTTHFERIV